MNVFTSLAEVESFCAGILVLVLSALLLLLYITFDYIKINKNIRKIEKRVNILFRSIQHFVPDSQYFSQFLDMYLEE